MEMGKINGLKNFFFYAPVNLNQKDFIQSYKATSRSPFVPKPYRDCIVIFVK